MNKFVCQTAFEKFALRSEREWNLIQEKALNLLCEVLTCAVKVFKEVETCFSGTRVLSTLLMYSSKVNLHSDKHARLVSDRLQGSSD